MTNALHIAASGVRHANVRQQATAHNTANLSTPDSVSLRVSGREQSVGQGVETRVDGRLSAGQGLRSGDAVVVAVEQIATVHHAGASAHAVRTADAMLGSLLDTVG